MGWLLISTGLGGMNCSKVRWLWWLYSSVTILKATKLQTLKGWILWHLNYISVKLLYKNELGSLTELYLFECFCRGGPWGHRESNFLPKNDKVTEYPMGKYSRAKSVPSTNNSTGKKEWRQVQSCASLSAREVVIFHQCLPICDPHLFANTPLFGLIFSKIIDFEKCVFIVF